MRRPTPDADLYRWHSAALAKRNPPITHEAQCGWFKRRLVKGGPFVAARIWVERDIDPDTGELMSDEAMKCEIDGKSRDAYEEWTYVCYLPITEAEYKFLTANADWARKYAPNEPAAHPERATDFNKLPLDM